jgi:predicted XRE-type DNA-binding protein
VRGKINFFALDKLVNMAARAGLDVTLTVQKRELAA